MEGSRQLILVCLVHPLVLVRHVLVQHTPAAPAPWYSHHICLCVEASAYSGGTSSRPDHGNHLKREVQILVANEQYTDPHRFCCGWPQNVPFLICVVGEVQWRLFCLPESRQQIVSSGVCCSVVETLNIW